MIRVIIVEDDPMVREINEKFLSKLEGYTLCASVGSLDQAKSIMEEVKPQLILLDMFFPNGKGLEFLKWIRQNNYNTDVIMITADKEKESIKESLRFGVIDYLIKPFVFERFKESLDSYKIRNERFDNIDIIEQGALDLITFKERELLDEYDECDIASYIKGFNNNTFKKILDGIEEMKGCAFTSKELAEKIGVSRITARRYLDYLEGDKKLILELEYGKVGRPKNMYKVRE